MTHLCQQFFSGFKDKITFFSPGERIRVFFLAITLICVTTPLLCQLKAFYPPYNVFLGARACSLGNAFTAVADDLSAVFWNPAGIADFLDPMVYMNWSMNRTSHIIPVQQEVEGSPSRSWKSDFSSSLKNIDFISVSAPAVFWNVRWNFALSYYRYFPYNHDGESISQLTTEGEMTDIEKTILAFSGKNGIDIMGFSLGVYLSEYFSIGFTWQHFFNSGTIEFRLQSGDEDVITSLHEKIRGQNLIIGCMLKAEKSVQLGFCYATGMNGTLSSSVHYENPGDSVIDNREDEFDLYIPPRFSMAVAIQPQKNWRLTYDFSKAFWSRASISIAGDSESEIPFPVREDYEMEQENVVNHRLGLEINFSVEKMVFFVRGGLFWEKQLFRDGRGQGVWVKGFSAGLGAHILSQVVIDLAYMSQSARWDEPGYFETDSWIETHFRNHVFAISVSYIFKKRTK